MTFHGQGGVDRRETDPMAYGNRINPVFGTLRKPSPKALWEEPSADRHLKSGQSCWRGVQGVRELSSVRHTLGHSNDRLPTRLRVQL